ncbi:MAG: RNA-binding protein [Dehalococcoidia bacterium]|nr:RNA-binding protein [Dehalococcoidia bacterium]
MPRGPNGERRPADTVANAIHVAKIATGEIEDETPSAKRNGGLVGGNARRDTLSPERRSEIARKAAKARWKQGAPDRT